MNFGAVKVAWTQRNALDDPFCIDCQKPLSEHDLCGRSDVRPDGCGHYTCDCICDFLRDEWPTHPANPEASNVP